MIKLLQWLMLPNSISTSKEPSKYLVKNTRSKHKEQLSDKTKGITQQVFSLQEKHDYALFKESKSILKMHQINSWVSGTSKGPPKILSNEYNTYKKTREETL
ncbi:hypothetical protein [Spiroplasma poulsonii]|uniref:hypothetical protein n=1 Tax=Spiroplasma poulsonii TaxID=2138 RepID=UPI001F4CC2F2|nr:hypothetical protein [Spiroplasma poulsonii]UNF61192.1 hypothetical protein MNU24_04560 [Spiroplasma poulsonii]